MSEHPTDSVLAYSQYCFETYMQPVWQGHTVYNEIVMFYPHHATKTVEPAPLLYTPERVLSVRSYDLQTEYVEGEDYVVENGCIVRTADSRIKAWAYEDYYLEQPSSVPLPCTHLPGRYFVFGSGAVFAPYQVCVTYTHRDDWQGPIPTWQGHKLPRTMQTLLSGGELNVVYYGPSGTAGKEASGLLGIAPYMPRWTDLVTTAMEQAAGATVHAVNTAVSGKKIDWGLDNVQERVIAYKPDLLLLEFGGNDGSAKWPCDKFKTYNRRIIEAVREQYPACEVLLVTPYLFNPYEGSRNGPQALYQTGLLELAEEMPGVAVANMTEVNQYILGKKRYGDVTGNNVNHHNDFLIRVTAQVVCAALLPEDILRKKGI